MHIYLFYPLIHKIFYVYLCLVILMVDLLIVKIGIFICRVSLLILFLCFIYFYVYGWHNIIDISACITKERHRARGANENSQMPINKTTITATKKQPRKSKMTNEIFFFFFHSSILLLIVILLLFIEAQKKLVSGVVRKYRFKHFEKQ